MKKTKAIKKPKTKGVAKVPTVMQLEAVECGAASLAMVMAYYEKWVPLEQVRVDCGVSRDGSNAKNLLIAARNYGFVASGYRLEVEDLRENGVFPCIIHWNFNHFVVLNGFRGNKAIINDPARGTYSVSMEVFDESFTGVCLLIRPGEQFEAGGKPKSILAFTKSRLKGAGVAIAFAAICTLISALIGIISPAFNRIFMDRLLTGKNPDWFYPFLVALSLMTVLNVVVSAVQELFSNKINAKLATVGSTKFLWKLLHLPTVFFSQRMAGDLQARHRTNSGIANDLVNTFAPLVLDSVMLVFYLVVMLRYSPLLTLIGLSSLVLNSIISAYISKKRVSLTRVQVRDAGKLASTTVAGIEMAETIKASGAENGFFQKWAGYQASVNAQQVKHAKMDQYLGLLPSVVSLISNTLISSLGVYFVINGEFTIGMVMAFQGFLSSFMSPAMQFVTAGQTIVEMRTSMERVEDVMKYPDDVIYENESAPKEEGEGEESGSLSKLRGSVELKNITFGYSPLAKPLLVDFNMTLKPGSKVALVGGSGCGKSTIAKLIAGLYQPWSGEILFDGLPSRQIPREVITGSIAVVDQEITLFEDTVANNIKMWDKTIEDFEMIMAARDAHIHEDIMRREGGYQYKLREGGSDFSGGQRQRLEIARVLAQDPSIIILDEATSALDAKTEYEVVQAIKNRGVTCIVVAHRLSTVRDCDEIIVLDNGEVVERGTHDELCAKGGKYTELVTNN